MCTALCSSFSSVSITLRTFRIQVDLMISYALIASASCYMPSPDPTVSDALEHCRCWLTLNGGKLLTGLPALPRVASSVGSAAETSVTENMTLSWMGGLVRRMTSRASDAVVDGAGAGTSSRLFDAEKWTWTLPIASDARLVWSPFSKP